MSLFQSAITVGVFSENVPQYKPTFELNKTIVQRAEHYPFEFALSMIKLRELGGKTEFWDHNLESSTLMAGLAAVTERIRLYATAATLGGRLEKENILH